MKISLLDGERAVILELITLRSIPPDGVNLTTSRVVAKILEDFAIPDLNVMTSKDAKRSDEFETDLESLNWVFDELTSRLKQNMMPASRSVYIVMLYDKLRSITEDKRGKNADTDGDES